MIQTAQNIPEVYDNHDNIKVELTIPLFVAYRLRGYTQSDIARITNNSRSVVSDFKIKHSDKFAVLEDQSDGILGLKHKHAADLSVDHRINLLSNDRTRKKISYSASAVGGGIDEDKYLLSTGKATQRVDMSVTRRSAQEKLVRIRELEAEGIEVS